MLLRPAALRPGVMSGPRASRHEGSWCPLLLEGAGRLTNASENLMVALDERPARHLHLPLRPLFLPRVPFGRGPTRYGPRGLQPRYNRRVARSGVRTDPSGRCRAASLRWLASRRRPLLPDGSGAHPVPPARSGRGSLSEDREAGMGFSQRRGGARIWAETYPRSRPYPEVRAKRASKDRMSGVVRRASPSCFEAACGGTSA